MFNRPPAHGIPDSPGEGTAERPFELSEEQTGLLERFSPEFRERHIGAPHTDSLVAVDTFFVGTLKGVGKVYMQSAIDRHSRHAWARLYPSKLPVTAVHTLNNDELPTYDEHGARIEVVLSDSGREFCGRPDQHPTSCSCTWKRSNTALDEHFRFEGRKTWFETIDEMQRALDQWLAAYNSKRPHQGRGMKGRTPLEAFIDGLPASPAKPAPKPKGAMLTTSQKQASMQTETRAA